jgi:hypothetical protein
MNTSLRAAHFQNAHRFFRGVTFRLIIAAFLSCMFLFTALAGRSFLTGHSSTPTAEAAAPSMPVQFNIPYFGSSPVPFSQTAIFWFGDVTPSDNYINVRMGYNNSELYIDLHIVDQYLWYDPHGSHPNLNMGDESTIYLDTAPNGSNAPDSSSFKFLAQVDQYQQRTYYQEAFRGNGSGWAPSSIPFTTVSGWRGGGFNNMNPAEGWTMTYHLPFSSLGWSGPPSQGTAWKMAIKIQNQDSPNDNQLAYKWWPAAGSDSSSSNWGAIDFGMPAYQPPHTSNSSSYTIRNGFNNQVVTDAMVGGDMNCFNEGKNRWTQFGSQTYPGADRVNIEDEADISDFNCLSKFYINFPLTLLPPGKAIISAKVTLFEWGNAGGHGPNPSLIQVATVPPGWNPNNLSWNNAPLVQEDISRTVVNVMPTQKEVPPGVPYTWNVSQAVANAYDAKQPLSIAFFSSDSAYSTAKYFFGSTVASWNAGGRPMLQITLGTPTSSPAGAATASASVKGLSLSSQYPGGKGLQTESPLPLSLANTTQPSVAPAWHMLYFTPLLALALPLFIVVRFARRKKTGLRFSRRARGHFLADAPTLRLPVPGVSNPLR